MKETQDVFSNFHSLFAETVLQFSADIYKPDPTIEKHLPLAHLNKCIPLYCSYISTKQTDFVKKQAKRLLLIICGNKRKYYQVRDHALFEKNFAKLSKLAIKSVNFKEELSYDENVKLVSGLSHLLENAWVRPLNWQAFVVKNDAVLKFLFNTNFVVNEEAVSIILKLLGNAFITISYYKKTEEEKKKKKKKRN